MIYAKTIQNFLKAFDPEPLTEDQLPEFYCEGTIELRTGDKHESPIADIIEACQIPSLRNSFLLVGHRGCGKSTELTKMAVELKKQGYYVKNIDCKKELDLLNLTHTDLLTLMGEALIDIANETKCSLSKELTEQIYDFWDERESTAISEESGGMGVEAGIEVKPSIPILLSLFTKVKSDLKYNETYRETRRKKVINRSSDWILLLKELSDIITDKLDGKQPILIFEGLDKTDPHTAWNIFEMYSSTLTEVSFPVIYTFPIALYYSPKFNALRGYFNTECFPMIKQEDHKGNPFPEGTAIITEIVKKRADLSLFEDGVLELMIKKTGGSLRNLFEIILNSARTASRGGVTTISMEDARRALTRLRSDITRYIERKHYAFLADIYRGNRTRIEDKEMLLELLNAGVVLEYNGTHWFDLHPLIAEFLEEQNLTNE
jgi:energy-coupling factor transporter ATP-binding protein EcfA2